jgi:glutamate-ammonia-ligase adenylyltransferase
MIATIRTWHYGRYKATQSVEARERLTELTPALLRAFANTGRPDDTLIAFDGFIQGLPAGVQLFSLLHSNPTLLDLLMRVMGAAPKLAAIITRRPHVFDGLLDPALFADLPTKAYLAERLVNFLRGATAIEDILDRLRIFAAEQKFLIGMRLLSAAIDASRAGKAFSDLADLVIAKALDAVVAEFEWRHGKIAGGSILLLGMGKLGSRELTAGSDVDLILLYDHDECAEESDGAKPLAPSHYYARLTQRMIAAISAPTAEGVLYEIDMRLRPSGNKGPVATHIESFEKYQKTEAWTWEHMALTRARPVAGGDALGRRAMDAIGAVIAERAAADPKSMLKDAREMRLMIETEKPARNLWDVKLAAGGLIDLEFIAQTAVLRGAVPLAGRPVATMDVIKAIGGEFIETDARDDLASALALYQSFTQITRLCIDGGFDPGEAPARLTEIVLATADLPDIDVLEAHLRNTETSVRNHFDRWFGGKRG